MGPAQWLHMADLLFEEDWYHTTELGALVIEEAATGDDVAVRAAVANGLGHPQNELVDSHIRRLIDDPEPLVRGAAKAVLTKDERVPRFTWMNDPDVMFVIEHGTLSSWTLMGLIYLLADTATEPGSEGAAARAALERVLRAMPLGGPSKLLTANGVLVSLARDLALDDDPRARASAGRILAASRTEPAGAELCLLFGDQVEDVRRCVLPGIQAVDLGEIDGSMTRSPPSLTTARRRSRSPPSPRRSSRKLDTPPDSGSRRSRPPTSMRTRPTPQRSRWPTASSRGPWSDD